jgi:hypothetical protein
MTAELARTDIERMLGLVDAEIRVIRDVERRVAALTAPKFSFFDFLRTDEIGLSNCIAALLNPRGTHGQGSTYLELFVKALGCGGDWHTELGMAAVATETPANGLRRYDIEIRLTDRRAIVIENKPWAGDQPLQLADYALELGRTCRPGGWKLVYLSHGEPSEKSISKIDQARYRADRNLEVMTFHQLSTWLDLCAQRTRPPAVRLFIEQLERYVRENLCGEAGMSETETIKDVVMASQGNLRAALLLGRTLDEVKRRLLITGLKEPLASALGEQFFWDDTLVDQKKDAGFGVRPSHGAPGYLQFIFEFGGWGGFFWGIRRTHVLANGEADHLQADALRDTLQRQFGKGGHSNHWFWYSVNMRPLATSGVPPLPRYWQYEEAPWLAMQRQDLHHAFLELIRQVNELVESSEARVIFQGPTTP